MLPPSGPADREARQALPWPGGELDFGREHTLGVLRVQATAAPLLAVQSPVPQPGSKAHTDWMENTVSGPATRTPGPDGDVCAAHGHK